MKNNMRYLFVLIIVTAILFTGCDSKQDTKQEAGTDVVENNIETANSVTSQVVVDTEFTANDLDVGYEDSTATHITLEEADIEISGDGAVSEGGVLTINEKGTYVITGTLSDGQIIVDVKDTDKVQLVFNGVNINCPDNAPIYIKNADKVFITLKEGTVNTLTDGTEYIQKDENNVDGVIYSKADLSINGDGTLNITGNYKHGIVSKDDLIITGGTFQITAVKDALNGKDCVKIKDGTFHLSTTTGNGIQSKNDEDATKGFVYITGGNITISDCREGIEGTVIHIADGTIDITAEDDGLNASSGEGNAADENMPKDAQRQRSRQPGQNEPSGQEIPSEGEARANQGFQPGQGNFEGRGAFEVNADCYISITGGILHVDAQGDGIDSNGNLFISGGTVYVSGPVNSGNGALDYNGSAEITGGTVIAAGSAGMSQGFSDTSSQYSLLYNLSTVCEAGTEIKLTDKEGNAVISFTPDKQYQSVVISTPELIKDATYTLTCGDQTAQITLSSVVTGNGQQGMGSQRFGGSVR